MKNNSDLTTIFTRLASCIVGLALLWGPVSAFAAVDQFLRIEGVKGESVDKVHRGEIDVLAWSWGGSQSGTTHLATGGGAGKVNVQDLSITKYVDSASVLLWTNLVTAKHYPYAKLTVRKAGKVPLEYVVIEMKNVIVSSISTGGSGDEDRLTENVTLNFAEFKVTYTTQKPDGSAGPAQDLIFNIAENVVK